MYDEHVLKCYKEFFMPILSGHKKFEIRKNDRDYKQGDVLILQETHEGQYTGRNVSCDVNYILTHEQYPDGIKPGYCVMAIVVTQTWCD